MSVLLLVLSSFCSWHILHTKKYSEIQLSKTDSLMIHGKLGPLLDQIFRKRCPLSIKVKYSDEFRTSQIAFDNFSSRLQLRVHTTLLGLLLTTLLSKHLAYYANIMGDSGWILVLTEFAFWHIYEHISPGRANTRISCLHFMQGRTKPACDICRFACRPDSRWLQIRRKHSNRWKLYRWWWFCSSRYTVHKLSEEVQFGIVRIYKHVHAQLT